MLKNKKILLGVTGGIAAYKSAELCRLLIKAGATVQVVMTHSAEAFITPLTFQALTHRPVYTQVLDSELESGMGHIDLARWADFILIAPASAHCLAQCAQGLAPDLLTTLCLVTTAPIYVAPAMNQQMWQHPATQENCTKLLARGVKILGPGIGEQACGEFGPGRMLEPADIIQLLSTPKQTDLHFVMTAGPTQEPIDPVRYISNRSSGKMGFALAQVLAELGHAVHLVHGPVSLAVPQHLTQVIGVTTAQEMHDSVHAILSSLEDQHKDNKKIIFISVAAVSDFKVKSPSLEKRKKSVDLSSALTLECESNPDILASVSNKLVGRPDYCVGFALETAEMDSALDYAAQKLVQKNLDMIVLNQLQKDIAFEQDNNAVTVLLKQTVKQKPLNLGKAPKIQIAQQLVKIILNNIVTKTTATESIYAKSEA